MAPALVSMIKLVAVYFLDLRKHDWTPLLTTDAQQTESRYPLIFCTSALERGVQASSRLVYQKSEKGPRDVEGGE